jgi:hypothetical protein
MIMITGWYLEFGHSFIPLMKMNCITINLLLWYSVIVHEFSEILLSGQSKKNPDNHKDLLPECFTIITQLSFSRG